ncbi:MAG: hypothetical protein K1060chlam4_00429, partial [Candidatus Anoxychlamydiales bacterium]|nr:hypothetical protein [Candidatus Anoxychlamydiales bacterium]
SRDCHDLANNRSTWSNVIENIGFTNLEGQEAATTKIKKAHELGKLYFPIQEESYIDIFTHTDDPYIKYRNIKKPKESITIENTKETLRKINEIKIRDTLKVWQKVYSQAQQIAEKPAIEIPRFDELKKSTDKKAIKKSFADWINNNKDNFDPTQLSLSFLQLNYLPKEIGSLGQLQRLYLWSNNLTSIPKEIGSLAQLQELGLWRNNLTSIPKEIGSLTLLRELMLRDNKLTSIPKQIGDLTLLRTLDLSKNNFSSIPEEIGNLAQLESLDLRNNSISYYPKCLDRLTNTVISVEINILIAHEVIRFLGGHIAHHLYNKIYGPITD